MCIRTTSGLMAAEPWLSSLGWHCAYQLSVWRRWHVTTNV